MVYYCYEPVRRTCCQPPPTSPSIFDGLTLRPLPYPVLLILVVILSLLRISWFSSYEEVVEETKESINWAFYATPVLLLLFVKWVSSLENQGRRFVGYGYGYSAPCYYGTKPCAPPPCEQRGAGASPWGVAGLIVLCLILVQYQSLFLDRWFI